jgi:hypothetical protein
MQALQGRGHGDIAIVALGTLGMVLAAVLMALPGIWYIGWAGAGPGRHLDVMTTLVELVELDASWERAALQSMGEFAPASPAFRTAALAGMTTRLQAAAKGTASPALQRSLPDVVRALKDKAELVGRFHTAHAASRSALREALAMEPEIAGLLRDAWRDAPDRQRLVAVDNVVTQLMAEAQRYYYAPADSTRKHLEASTADLRSATATLPDILKPAAVRLERHAADLLRAKPPEQEYFDRVRFHDAGPRAATLTRELHRELVTNEAARERYRVYLAAYFCALMVLIAYLTARLIRRELSAGANREHGLAVANEAVPVEPALPQAQTEKTEA